MIEATKIDMYDWFEIQEELCRIMGIDSKYFRDYHQVVGGDYKDFWHVCLDSIVPDHMSNDTIVVMYSCDDAETYKGDDAWKNEVLKAWNKFYNEALGEGNTDSGIYVNFSW